VDVEAGGGWVVRGKEGGLARVSSLDPLQPAQYLFKKSLTRSRIALSTIGTGGSFNTSKSES